MPTLYYRSWKLRMPNYRNKSKIVKREELIPPGKLEEGMIITFRYNSGSDKTPVVLVIYYDRKKKMIEGINLNYITISRVGRLVELMGDAKVGVDKDEMIDEFEKDITRIQLSSKKRRDNMTPEKFYKDVVKGDSIIKRAYRSYKLEKVSSLKAADIRENLLG